MDLSHLNKPQRDAVLTTEGPLLVLAGAGSGKTRVITHRICHLLDMKVPARAILAVTFTNKAASEMKERVVQMGGQRALGVTLSTFHAFGAEVLREHLHKMGWPKKFAIVDTGDQIALVRRAMKDRQIDDKVFDPRKILTLISRAKNSGEIPGEGPRQPLIAEDDDDLDDIDGEDSDDLELAASMVFPLYQLALKAQGAVDFDDLIVFPSRIFEQFPEVKQHYGERFRYIMVDEYQDTNKAQLELLRHLGDAHHNVCVVGDDDQCIYSWRGAEVRNILDFEKLFPGGKEVRLEQNYRSNQVILDAANSVIEKNPDRRSKRMWSDVKAGPKITLCSAPSEEDEARWVASEVKRAVGEGMSPDDIAILYRVNGQSRFLEEFLREREVRYEVHGGTEFFDRREVKDVIAYFRVIANPKDEISLLRIINTPARGIGDVTMERINAWALKHDTPLWKALERSAEIDTLPHGAAEKVLGFVALMERYRGMFDKGNLSKVTSELLKEIDFMGNARANAPSLASGDRKAQAVKHVIQSLENYEKKEGPKASLLTYLNRLSLDTKDDEDEHQHLAGRVSMMTIHGSKGLEWKMVFVVGCEEDLLPHSGMQGEAPNPGEERRLCYVAMTRARDRLIMTRATTRVKRGKELPRTPSRFLGDIPEQLCEVIDMEAIPKGPPTPKEKNFFANLRERLKAESGNGPTS
ncbi:MAG: DNA helicase UvrD [Archangium gephyra]|uniref:DNA 3'-5' helicase n=1 Tax=Archangium gephyra TaxID=48 RepID=A0A2W5TPQ8_9BACT|nr:MAG: DNA helicase UvrD [Archangium gephyra]